MSQTATISAPPPPTATRTSPRTGVEGKPEDAEVGTAAGAGVKVGCGTMTATAWQMARWWRSRVGGSRPRAGGRARRGAWRGFGRWLWLRRRTRDVQAVRGSDDEAVGIVRFGNPERVLLLDPELVRAAILDRDMDPIDVVRVHRAGGPADQRVLRSILAEVADLLRVGAWATQRCGGRLNVTPVLSRTQAPTTR
jgi:hypothetical protein